MDRSALPRTIMGYVVRSSGRHQIALAALSAAVFGLSSVPLELQRRVVNDAIKNGATETIMWLAIAYAGVAVLEQALKMALNLYRSWVSEDAVRTLRKTLEDVEGAEPCERDATGTHTAMAVAEAEPIGGFVGMAISEPLLQVGILVSVIGYMTSLEWWALALSAGFLLPQLLFVPALQHAINRRAEDRIKTLRQVSGDIVEGGTPDDRHVERVFELNMGIYRFKFGMNLGMNLMYAFAVAVALGVGGWFAASGRIDVGTVVAVVSGLGKLKDPWSDLVSWGRELSVDSVKYRLFVDAVGRRGLATA
jgi:ABC-type multidrug transport system fused ATPase/permease subunit